MKKAILVLTMIALFTVTFSYAALASGQPDRLALFNDLNLTQTQKDKITKILETKGQPQAPKSKKMEMRKWRTGKPVDPKAIAEFKAQRHLNQGKIAQIKKILTKDQLQKLQAKFAQFKMNKGKFIRKTAKSNLTQQKQIAG